MKLIIARTVNQLQGLLLFPMHLLAAASGKQDEGCAQSAELSLLTNEAN